MTQLPPPGTTPINYGRSDAAPQANALAITSLVCGLIGCAIVTPIVAIITGVMALGRARRQGGRGMAVAGIVLGCLWCVAFVGLGIAAYFIYQNAATIIATAAKPQTIALINRVQGGNTVRDATTAGLTDAAMQDIAQISGPLGQCRDISLNSSNLLNRNGVVTLEFRGVATFDKGTAPIDAAMRVDKQTAGQPTVYFNRLSLR